MGGRGRFHARNFKGQDGSGEEEEELQWEAEEDFTLEHVFNSPDDDDDDEDDVNSPDEDEEDEDDVSPRMEPVGFVYYPTNSTQIHITPNITPVQPRKGNISTIFEARGHAYLDPVNITFNTSLASDDRSLVEDEFEADLIARLVRSKWDGDAFEEYRLFSVFTITFLSLHRPF
ncbi:hypothetical protein AAF712_008634 [Marasmius tenuissimus]|uniref:Uncharacterized protein n=1 Tax=Marasmius tenuissimus TaxID=585030 RepID=A0ABR2ZS21_9AGAR